MDLFNKFRTDKRNGHLLTSSGAGRKNPRANTCSPTCTHARDCGLSRGAWVRVMAKVNSRRIREPFHQPRRNSVDKNSL